MANKKSKETQDRWTIVNMEKPIKDDIVEFAAQNGYTVARAVKELTRRGLRKWHKKNDEQ